MDDDFCRGCHEEEVSFWRDSILLCLEDVVVDAKDVLSKGLIAVRLQA